MQLSGDRFETIKCIIYYTEKCRYMLIRVIKPFETFCYIVLINLPLKHACELFPAGRNKHFLKHAFFPFNTHLDKIRLKMRKEER